MSFRPCPTCGTEVEDVGGFCLLGHPLRLAAPTDSLAALRAEVNKAFEDVEVRVAEVLAVGPKGHAIAAQSPTVPAPVEAPTVTTEAAAVAPPVAAAPPPPPPARSRMPEFEPSSGADPITEFAPAPKMDWGPERGGLLRRFG